MAVPVNLAEMLAKEEGAAMPPKSFLKEVIYPLIMRFAVVVMLTITVSLGLALIVSAMDEANQPVRNISEENLTLPNELPAAAQAPAPVGQAVQIRYDSH